MKGMPRNWNRLRGLRFGGKPFGILPPIRLSGSAAPMRARIAGSPGLAARLAKRPWSNSSRVSNYYRTTDHGSIACALRNWSWQVSTAASTKDNFPFAVDLNLMKASRAWGARLAGWLSGIAHPPDLCRIASLFSLPEHNLIHYFNESARIIQYHFCHVSFVLEINSIDPNVWHCVPSNL
jgi:hypothetical protein